MPNKPKKVSRKTRNKTCKVNYIPASDKRY